MEKEQVVRLIDGEEPCINMDFETENAEVKRRGMVADVLVRLIHNKSAMIGLFFLVVIIGACVLAPVIAPYGYDDQNVVVKFTPPCKEYICGTDQFGRDIFTRILYGGRISLLCGFVATAVSAVIGTILGGVAAYYGGKVDNIIMRILDVFMAIPTLLLAIVISATLGNGIVNAMLAVGISNIPRMARTARGPILAEKNMEYIEAGRSMHASDWRMIFRHILPNVLSPIIVSVTLGVANSIINTASLSFLGLGVQPPYPEWGSMLSSARVYIRSAGYMVTFPGVAIALVVIALNLFGDGLRDCLDPRLKN